MTMFWRFLLRHRIVHFLFVGGISTLVNLSATFVLTSIFGLWYIASASVAFVLAYIINFSLQKIWTFQSTKKEGSLRQLALHLCMQMGNLILETAGLYALVEYLGLWYLYAQIPVLALLSIESFFITRFIFAHKAPGT